MTTAALRPPVTFRHANLLAGPILVVMIIGMMVLSSAVLFIWFKKSGWW